MALISVDIYKADEVTHDSDGTSDRFPSAYTGIQLLVTHLIAAEKNRSANYDAIEMFSFKK